VAQLYCRALCSFFVACYDSQGYGGVILTRLQTGLKFVLIGFLHDTDRIENDDSEIICYRGNDCSELLPSNCRQIHRHRDPEIYAFNNFSVACIPYRS
jgi:hypothetical protein